MPVCQLCQLPIKQDQIRKDEWKYDLFLTQEGADADLVPTNIEFEGEKWLCLVLNKQEL